MIHKDFMPQGQKTHKAGLNNLSNFAVTSRNKHTKMSTYLPHIWFIGKFYKQMKQGRMYFRSNCTWVCVACVLNPTIPWNFYKYCTKECMAVWKILINYLKYTVNMI